MPLKNQIFLKWHLSHVLVRVSKVRNQIDTAKYLLKKVDKKPCEKTAHKMPFLLLLKGAVDWLNNSPFLPRRKLEEMTDSDNDTMFIYKCRNCGEKFYDPRVTDVTHAKWHLNSLVHNGEGIDIGYAISPKLIETHGCSEEERGLADLIGIGREENK